MIGGYISRWEKLHDACCSYFVFFLDFQCLACLYDIVTPADFQLPPPTPCYPRRLSARACRHVTSVGTQGCGLEIVRALETTYPQAWDAGLSTSSGLLVCTTSLPPTTFSTCLSPRHFRRNPGLGVGDLCGRLTRLPKILPFRSRSVSRQNVCSTCQTF